jgi:hypothetical protein
MKGYWAVTTLLVLCFLSARADDKPGVPTIGTGTFSCAKFTKYDAAPKNSDQMNLIVQWVWGFVSAYNLRAAFSPTFQENDAPNSVSPPDSASTLLVIRKFCQKNPLSNVASATLDLISASGGIVTSNVTVP